MTEGEGVGRFKRLDKAALREITARGGRIGGKVRAAALSKEQRSAIAKKAAAARWAKEKG